MANPNPEICGSGIGESISMFGRNGQRKRKWNSGVEPDSNHGHLAAEPFHLSAWARRMKPGCN
jgi:hypothetical protein